jgi:hypothetical protein
MNNFYHKLAFASVCTVLSFTLGVNKEAKAARFDLTATKFFIDDIYAPNGLPNPDGSIYYYPDGKGADGLGDRLLNSRYDNEFIMNDFPSVEKRPWSFGERRAFYEFNISNLSLAPNTVIRSAIFQQRIEEAQRSVGRNRFLSLDLEIFGYVGNGRPDLSDFGAGVSLGIKDAVALSDPNPYYGYPYGYYTNYNGGILSFDVTGFVNERVSNRDTFAGFGIRVSGNALDDFFSNLGEATLSDNPYLTIETVEVAEPVPEPTTIFGSAIGLCLGGWLKRKKLTLQNKTTSQD